MYVLCETKNKSVFPNSGRSCLLACLSTWTVIFALVRMQFHCQQALSMYVPNIGNANTLTTENDQQLVPFCTWCSNSLFSLLPVLYVVQAPILISVLS